MTEKGEESKCGSYTYIRKDLFSLNLKEELKEAHKFGHKRSNLLYIKVTPHLKEIIQTQFSEFILQMHTEVHVLYRMDHNVDELHAGHLVYEQKHNKHKPGTRSQRCQKVKSWSSRDGSVKRFSYHEINVSIFTAEVLHQLFKPVLFLAHLQGKRRITVSVGYARWETYLCGHHTYRFFKKNFLNVYKCLHVSVYHYRRHSIYYRMGFIQTSNLALKWPVIGKFRNKNGLWLQ